jgi:hypothetical protein
MRILATAWAVATAVVWFGPSALAQEERAASQRTLPGAATCKLELPDSAGPEGGWSAAERWAWNEICLGRVADMSRAPSDTVRSDSTRGDTTRSDSTRGATSQGGGAVCNPADIAGPAPANRVLRPEFLQLILTRDPWASGTIRPVVTIQCARIAGALSLDSQRVAPETVIDDSEFTTDVSLNGARFDRLIRFEGSRFHGQLSAQSLQVGDGLFLQRAHFDRDVSLTSAKVAGIVAANGSIFDGALIADNLTASDLFFGYFGAGDQRRGARFAGSVSLVEATISGRIEIGATAFDDTVNLTSANVRGNLVLSSQPLGAPSWGPKARLILRNTRTNALQAERHAWEVRAPEGAPEGSASLVLTDLTGFTYARLGGLNADLGAQMSDEDGSWLVRWVEAQEGHAEHYDPQPYEQLASVLKTGGLDEQAQQVRFAKFVHRDAIFEHAGTTKTISNEITKLDYWRDYVVPHFVVHPIERNVVGYGVYPQRALGWFLGAVFLGWILLMIWPEAGVGGRFLDALLFSFGNALPLINFGEVEIVRDFRRPWLRQFFSVQKFAGFVLGTILAATLSVLGTG